jgi:hypothetical protein
MSWLLSKRLRQSIVGDLPSFKMKTWWEPSKTVVATTQNYGSNTEPAARLPATSTKYLIANKKNDYVVLTGVPAPIVYSFVELALTL